MSFSDFFVPKYLHSKPKVRIKFVNRTKNVQLLEKIVENDQDNSVVRAAQSRIQALTVSETA